MKLQSAEHQEQVVIADFLRRALRPPTAWTGLDHANAKNRLAGALRKARGVKAGLPDLMVFHPLTPAPGTLVLAIELKAGKRPKKAAGRQSDEQRDMQRELEAAGAIYTVCYTLEQVCALLSAHGIPLHARLMSSRAMVVPDKLAGQLANKQEGKD